MNDRPNDPQVLVVTSGQQLNDFPGLQRVLDLFDGNSPEALASAQKRMTFYKNQGYALTLWCQTLQGTWEEKNAF